MGTLTLNDVWDHERGTGVIADKATAGQVVFDLQGKQVATVEGAEKHTVRQSASQSTPA